MNISKNIQKLREDFEILKSKVIYFDNACMSLKPRQVLEKMNEYYLEYPGCAGRSIHHVGERVGKEVLLARKKIARFFNAKRKEEVIFTKNTTEAINLAANCLGLNRGDRVLTSDYEHNSNLLPWIKLAREKGIMHEILYSKADNTFDLEMFKEKAKGARLVSIFHTSNLNGYTNPVKEIIRIAHENNALVLLDGAQSAPHIPINLKKLDADFFACSGHKMLGPNGTGILYGKKEHLENMKQFIVGGETVIDSSYNDFKMEESPARFEAGLQNYSGIIGFGSAVDYLRGIIDDIHAYESKLNRIISEGLMQFNKVELVPPLDYRQRGGIISFNIKGIDSHNVAVILNKSARICIRSGAHCVHSWFNAHNLKGSARASLYFYNTEQECLRFVEEMGKIARNF
ncbi:cysteine desulfurase [archaeon]|nr:cysteine desulfurase [archaeon]